MLLLMTTRKTWAFHISLMSGIMWTVQFTLHNTKRFILFVIICLTFLYIWRFHCFNGQQISIKLNAMEMCLWPLEKCRMNVDCVAWVCVTHLLISLFHVGRLIGFEEFTTFSPFKHIQSDYLHSSMNWKQNEKIEAQRNFSIFVFMIQQHKVVAAVNGSVFAPKCTHSIFNELLHSVVVGFIVHFSHNIRA